MNDSGHSRSILPSGGGALENADAANQETQERRAAMLKLFALGNEEWAQGRFRDAWDVLNDLDTLDGTTP